MADPNLSLQLDLFEMTPVAARVKAQRRRRAAGPVMQGDLFAPVFDDTDVKLTLKRARQRENERRYTAKHLEKVRERQRLYARQRRVDSPEKIREASLRSYRNKRQKLSPDSPAIIRKIRTPQQVHSDALQHIESRGGTIQERLPNSYYVIKCAEGHIWTQRAHTLVSMKTWCPRCKRWRREEMCRLVLQQLYRAEFPKHSPQWLRSKRGYKLFFDGYNPDLSLAFEYNGEQHYREISYMNTTLEYRRDNDAQKEALCELNNVILLTIPYWVDNDNLPQWIVNRLAELGAPKPPFSATTVYPVNPITRSFLQRLKNIASGYGGQCLDDIYKGADTHHRFRCSEGHEWEATPGNVLKGSWCYHCARKTNGLKRRITMDEAEKLAEKNGGKCLSSKTDEVQKGYLYHWECENGHRWWANITSVKSKGTWCPKCARKRMGRFKHPTIEDMRTIAQTRGGECLSKVYVNNTRTLLWRCKDGHEWFATPHNVKDRGSWCSKCADIKVGKARRLTIDEMHTLAKMRGGECLSTTYSCVESRLHWKCAKGHTFWMRPHTVKYQNSWCRTCFRERRGIYDRLTIEEMQELATDRGGQCLSDHYVSANDKLRWRCSDGHEWEAAPSSIKHQGAWCPYCRDGKPGANRLLTIEQMHRVAAKKGGECLSELYINSTTPLLWRCAQKHEWWAQPGNVRNNHSWCPECFNLKRGRQRDTRSRANLVAPHPALPGLSHTP